MRVLAVASEIFPLAKTGGLADVTGALPSALAELGVEVATLAPGYRQVLAALPDAETLHHDPALFGGPARLLRGRAAGLDLFVLDAPHLFAREGLYAGPDGDWPDNPFRFAALGRMAARIGQGLLPGWTPDVLHAHDWQAGLAPAYLHYDHLQFRTPRTPSVMTVHNLAFQGQAPAALLPALGLPNAAWDIEGVEYHGAVGFLKAGLRLADRVTTVSPGYAMEIRTPAGGMGLDGLLRARGAAFRGIVNGIDAGIWNPRADPALAARFDIEDMAGRGLNKSALRTRFGLRDDADAPLFGVVGRLSWQKGMDLLLAALPPVLEAGAQFLLLGAGEPALEAGFAALAARHPGQCGVVLGYDEALAHLVQGGIDILVAPSRFEPCGLTQLCAMRYGAVPVVTRVGGLADTVIDANVAALRAGTATGFLVGDATAEALAQGLARARTVFRDRNAWHALQRNGMRADWGWKQPAREYHELYKEIIQSGFQI